MHKKAVFEITVSAAELSSKLLAWSNKFNHFALYPGNNYPDPYHKYDIVFAAGAKKIVVPEKDSLDELYKTWQENPDWFFGSISYDLKNELEKVSSENEDQVRAPQLYFFVPEIVGTLQNNCLQIESISRKPDLIFAEILATSAMAEQTLQRLDFKARISKEKYLNKVRGLQEHIQQGDIYEVNFCQEFYAENTQIDPAQVFEKLNKKVHPPFAAFLNLPEHAVMCASPERYLQKSGRQLISQPIKGTARRSTDAAEEITIKNTLYNSVKERAENVMIVDLVRNDLSRVAANGSVNVSELFGVHTFPTVHQLISTVEAKLADNKTWLDALKTSFPMGSMTGAPKVSAMNLIEEYEVHKRGIYSGALGYITPTGDFDFNVVIRSLIYNKTSQYLSLSVGGAITILADAEEEYEECLLKAEAILNLFQKT